MRKITTGLMIIFCFWTIASFYPVSASYLSQNQITQDNCMDSYLQIGDCVYKSYENGKLRVRSSPDISSNENIIENAEEGSRMTILGGPVCNSGYRFWKVKTEHGTVGYAAEGSKYQRWMLLTDPANCSNITSQPISIDTPSPKYCPIKDCACSYLKVGDYITVSDRGSISVRSDPDLHPGDNIIYRAPVGSGMQIIDGPFCSWGWLVWKVRTDSGVIGFAPESDGTSWWMTPDENRNNPPVNPWNQPYNPWNPPYTPWTSTYTPWRPVSTPTAVPQVSGNCSLIYSIPPYLAKFFPNQETDFSWAVRNDSGETWTTDSYDVAFIRGTNMLKRKDVTRYDLPYNIYPGSSFSLTVDAIVPSAPGRYSMTFGVVENNVIVCSMDVTVDVNW